MLSAVSCGTSGTGDFLMVLYLCERCIKKLQKNNNPVLIGDLIPNAREDYECDICGDITDLFFCKA